MNKDGEHVLVIGGGIIGLCCGYFLSKSGHQVTIVDRDPTRKESCSDQNAGMVVPSHFIPLAAPGVISQGLKWMLNRRSPFYLRPRLDPALWRWCWSFIRHSNRRHVDDSKPLLRDLSLASRALFAELSAELEFDLVERGLLMLCQSEAGFEEEKEVATAANELGIRAEVCSPERLRELDSGAKMNALGGIWFEQDAHLDPMQFIGALRRAISANGGEFKDQNVVDFQTEEKRVTCAHLENGDEIKADRFVICGGAWSPEIAKKLDLHLPMQGGKGYSFTLPNPPELPQLCSLLKEGRVAITPMGKQLRIAGTMEICGNDLSIDRIRLEGIVDSVCRFFPAFSPQNFKGLEPWSGLRPCTPDGLPYLGPVPGMTNAIVATGHSMLGLSLGPITGKLVTAIVEGTLPDQRLSPVRA